MSGIPLTGRALEWAAADSRVLSCVVEVRHRRRTPVPRARSPRPTANERTGRIVVGYMLAFLAWLILFLLCWPLALLALLVYPLVWLVLLPFRLVGLVFDGVFQFLRALLTLPARLLGAKA